jgi:tRNA pseudouridine55 synthase
LKIQKHDEQRGEALLDDQDLGRSAGVYVVDKPAGITSLDVVRRLKGRMSNLRMGHTGTLDPLATGVLPVCVGEATKLVPYMELEPKAYLGSFELGVVTDSWDITGKVVERHTIPPLPREEILVAFREQEGLQYLEPPVFSAIKHKGRPLYTYARKGQFVEKPPRKTLIEAFHLLAREGDVLEFELTCSRGTYVRSVVHAIGKRLGCGACLRSLRRLRCGRFRIEEALPLDRLEERIERNDDAEVFLSPAEALDHLDAYDIQEPSEQKVCHGSPLRHEDLRHGDGIQGRIGEKFRIMVQGELAAVAEARRDPLGDFLQPVRVLRRAA